MIIYLVCGICLAAVGVVISAITGQWVKFMNIWETIGIVLMVVAAIISGSMNSGAKVRLDYTVLSDEEKKRQQNWTLKLFLLGIPSLIGTLVYYYLSK